MVHRMRFGALWCMTEEYVPYWLGNTNWFKHSKGESEIFPGARKSRLNCFPWKFTNLHQPKDSASEFVRAGNRVVFISAGTGEFDALRENDKVGLTGPAQLWRFYMTCHMSKHLQGGVAEPVHGRSSRGSASNAAPASSEKFYRLLKNFDFFDHGFLRTAVWLKQQTQSVTTLCYWLSGGKFVASALVSCRLGHVSHLHKRRYSCWLVSSFALLVP